MNEIYRLIELILSKTPDSDNRPTREPLTLKESKFDEYSNLEENALALLEEEREFFASMQNKRRLGEIIEIADKEPSYEEKAQKSLELLRDTS